MVEQLIKGALKLVKVSCNLKVDFSPLITTVISIMSSQSMSLAAPPPNNLSNLVDLARAAELRPRQPTKRKRASHLPPVEEKKDDQRQPRTYLRTSNSDRATVIHMYFTQNHTPAEIEKTLDGRVTQSNIHHIVQTYSKTSRIEKLPKGGRHKVYSDEDRRMIAAIQIEHSDWTYERIRQAWQALTNKPNMPLSNGTIESIFKEYGITTKTLQHEPVSRNKPSNIRKRFHYALEVKGIPDEQWVYIDEMGVNLHKKRGRGRALIGESAKTVRTDSRGGNITLCMIISPTRGVIKHVIQQGSFNSEVYAQFLGDFLNEELVTRVRSLFYVMDNVKFHKSEIVRSLFEDSDPQQILTYIPAYSPQLNAIEECFSKISLYLNQRRCDSVVDMMESMKQAVYTITQEDCLNYHNHVKKWLLHCEKKLPIGSKPIIEPESPNSDSDFDDDIEDEDYVPPRGWRNDNGDTSEQSDESDGVSEGSEEEVADE
jgi:transposase